MCYYGNKNERSHSFQDVYNSIYTQNLQNKQIMKNTIIEKYAGSCWGNSIDKSHLLKVSAYFDTVLKKNPPTTYNSPPKWLNCVQSSLLLWKSGLTYRLEMCNEIDWIFTPDLIGDEEIGCLKIALDLQRTHRKCAPKKGHVKYFQNWPDNICREFADISLMNMLTNAHNRAYIPQGGKKKRLIMFRSGGKEF